MSNNDPYGFLVMLGDPVVGATLTARPNGIKDKDGILRDTGEFQWLRDTSDIKGETYQTYVIKPEDAGKDIRVVFTYTDGKGNPEKVTSKPKSVPAPKKPRFIDYLYQKYMKRNADSSGERFWLAHFEREFVKYLPKKYKPNA